MSATVHSSGCGCGRGSDRRHPSPGLWALQLAGRGRHCAARHHVQPGTLRLHEQAGRGTGSQGPINIEKSITENLKAIAKAKNKDVEDLTTIILDRPRHDAMIAEIRKVGARIRIIPDGDVAAALMTAWPDAGVDVLIGIGGTPEGVLAACALRAMGGEIQGKLYARDADELRRGREAGYDFDKILTMEDLVSSEDVFFAATGITDGELLKGVRYFGDGARTDSIVVRGPDRHRAPDHGHASDGQYCNQLSAMKVFPACLYNPACLPR
jgi:fructose-1,6-bisphosphatase II